MKTLKCLLKLFATKGLILDQRVVVQNHPQWQKERMIFTSGGSQLFNCCSDVTRVQGSGHDLLSVTLIWTRTTTLQAWLDSVTSWKPLQIQNKWQVTQQKILWRPVLNGNAYMQPTAWEHQRTLTWTTHRHTHATADQLTSHVARLEDSNTRPSWGQRKHLPPANTTGSRPCTSVNGSVFSISQCRMNDSSLTIVGTTINNSDLLPLSQGHHSRSWTLQQISSFEE